MLVIFVKIAYFLGCGEGHFIFEKSKNEPNTLFIGVDRKHDRIFSCYNRVKNVENIKTVLSPIHLFLKDLIPNDTFDEILVQFSEPWINKKKRTVNNELIELFHQKLKLDGSVIISTDDLALIEWDYELFLKYTDKFQREFQEKYTTQEPKETMVEKKGYETIFRKNNKIIYYQKYKKIKA